MTEGSDTGDEPSEESGRDDGSEADHGSGDDGSGRTGPPAADYDALVDLTSQFYRGEMSRITTWRSRMDQSTNWAVVVMAAVLTWSFSSRENPHYVILVGALAVGVFLLVEAQRFQEYDAWRARIRTLQQDVFAPGFDGRPAEHEGWREWMGKTLRDPTIRLSLPLAIGHRLAHVYLPLLTVLLVAWWLRVTVFEPDVGFSGAAAIGATSGTVVGAVVAAVYLLLAALAIWSVRGEIRREFEYETGGEAGPAEE